MENSATAEYDLLPIIVLVMPQPTCKEIKPKTAAEVSTARPAANHQRQAPFIEVGLVNALVLACYFQLKFPTLNTQKTKSKSSTLHPILLAFARWGVFFRGT